MSVYVSLWESVHDADGDFAIFEGKRLVAVTVADTEWDAANARLIAAAPEMFEALEKLPLDSFGDDMSMIDAAEFVDHAGEFFEAMQLAKSAIRKAKGE